MPTKSAVKSRQKPKKTTAELEAILAERFAVPKLRVSVFGAGENWDAALLVRQAGNAERKARFRTLVYELRREFALQA